MASLSAKLPLPAPDPGDPGDPVAWRVENDVPGRRTACVDEHGSDYEVEGATVSERYPGRVEVSTETFAQRALATGDFTVRWPEATVRSLAELTFDAGATSYDIDLTVATWRDGEPFAERRWVRSIPRNLG